MEKNYKEIKKTTLLREYKLKKNNSATSIWYKKFTWDTTLYKKQSYLNFDDLENYWNNIWVKYWEKKQIYKSLYESYLNFFYWLELINSYFFYNEEIEKKIISNIKRNYFLIASSYLYGKKCNDIIKNIDNNFWETNKLQLFSETRNKIFEHNFNPNKIKWSFEININSIANRDWYLKVLFYPSNGQDKLEYYLSYFTDLFNEQNKLVEFIKKEN